MNQVLFVFLLVAISSLQCFDLPPSVGSILGAVSIPKMHLSALLPKSVGQPQSSKFDQFPVLQNIMRDRSRPVIPGSPSIMSDTSCNKDCNNYKAKATDYINGNHLRIPKAVRLLFHVCLGGGNGCINVKERANRGLLAFYKEARRFCNQQLSNLSLADCIVLVGISAAEVGMRKAGIRNPSIPFHTGRRTCSNPDRYDEEINFPQGNDPNAIELLEDAFSLSRPEAIALLGAHSLGSARRENSGFQGSWDNTQTTLDNGYYQSLAGNTWNIRRIGNTVQWNSRTSPHMMLVSDMTLLRDVDYDSRMQPSCPAVSRCPFSDYADTVRAYARNQNLWAKDFIKAIVKMTS